MELFFECLFGLAITTFALLMLSFACLTFVTVWQSHTLMAYLKGDKNERWRELCRSDMGGFAYNGFNNLKYIFNDDDFDDAEIVKRKTRLRWLINTFKRVIIALPLSVFMMLLVVGLHNICLP